MPATQCWSAGKLTTSSAADQPLEDDFYQVQHPEHTFYTSPLSPSSGFCLAGAINGVSVPMLVDTGAAVTLLRVDVWQQVVGRDPTQLEPCPTLRILGAGGEPLTVHGRAHLKLTLGAVSLPVQVVVVHPLTSPAILGLDFLLQEQATVNLSTRSLHLKERGCDIPLQHPALPSDGPMEYAVAVAATVEVPPRSMMLVEGTAEGVAEGLWLLEETAAKELPVAVARGLTEPQSSRVVMQVLNISEDPVKLYKGMTVGVLQRVEDPTGHHQVDVISEREDGIPEVDKQEMLQNLVKEASAELSPGERDIFYQLLLSFADIMACSTSELGKTDKLKHNIPTGDAPPIRQPVRRISPNRRQEVQQLLGEMLEGGVIEPSAGPWASPIVLVQKKDGSTRFCVDYRKLNDVTRKDAYPLPRIDATLDTLHGSKWFSTLDLCSGYWQVEVAEEDRAKTAFCTTEGLFQFRVMPFGLCNAPATFQRLMDLVLSGLQWGECLVYLDDVIVLGRTFDEHLHNLCLVLQRFREAGLRLKPSKCCFFRTRVHYLGHVISRDGIATDPAKTEKVLSWPTPTSKREVQQFLGFAGYYRRFVRDFSAITRPLHRLTERTASFKWTEECQRAFDELRQKLCSAPVLAFPDFSRQFILDTDASDVGIGGVLSQVDDHGNERVIAFGSRSLSKPERRYCVTRRELLAVVEFTSEYRPYLVGRRFVLRTDHGSLTWLRNFRDPDGQIARWLERLQELDFDTVHRRGRIHTNADALSRLPCQQCGRESHTTSEDLLVSVTAVLPPLPEGMGDKVRQAQLADTVLGPLLRGKEAGEKPATSELGNSSQSSRRLLQLWDQLSVSNGILCRKFVSPDGSAHTLQVVVPGILRDEVLTQLHEGAVGGHLGVDKTLARVKERFYWPGYTSDVGDWCSRCGVCAARKTPTPKARAPLTSIVTGYPLQLVAMDIVGPFPESTAGNSYVLVAADYFTRWVEAYPIPNQEAVTVATKLVNEFFCRFSLPERLHSDQGRNFESAVVSEVCKLLGIAKSRTTPYHPQSDGLVERFNRTLLDMLAKSVRDRPFEWEDHIRHLCLAYNTSVHPTTGYSPFFLMFGRQVRMPVDLMYGTPTASPVAVPEYVSNLRTSLTSAYERVRATMGTKLDRQKEFYDEKVHGDPFQEGDLVWLNTPAVPRGQSRKLHNPWSGPYRVVARLSDAVYRVQHTQIRRKRHVVHFDRLKRCPPNIRIPPRVATGCRTRTTPLGHQTQPIGTGLELVEDDTGNPPHQSHPNVTGDPPQIQPRLVVMGRSPCHRNLPRAGPIDQSADLPGTHPPSHSPTFPNHHPRYPRRIRTRPDRYCPGVLH